MANLTRIGLLFAALLVAVGKAAEFSGTLDEGSGIFYLGKFAFDVSSTRSLHNLLPLFNFTFVSVEAGRLGTLRLSARGIDCGQSAANR